MKFVCGDCDTAIDVPELVWGEVSDDYAVAETLAKRGWVMSSPDPFKRELNVLCRECAVAFYGEEGVDIALAAIRGSS